MQQVVDLQDDKQFQSMGIELLSISPDAASAWADEGGQLGVRTPMLSDSGNGVATRYDVMRWGMPSGEPGHTFVLIGSDGNVQWVRDYGAPEHGGLMYVPPPDLISELRKQVA